MSRVQAVVYETHVGNDDHKTVIMTTETLTVSDYSDEVTQEDIDRLHAHAAEKFGVPEFVDSSEAAW